jgi:hypothetical protein
VKTELEYLKLAFEAWCRSHKWDKGLPITAATCAEVLALADELRAADKKALETS